VLLLAFFSVVCLAHAQSGDNPDTVRILSEEINHVDEQLPPSPEIEYEEEESELATMSEYFEQRARQWNGGGPATLNSKKIPDSSWDHIKKDDDFWYASYPFDKKKNKSIDNTRKKSFTQTPGFQTLLWLVIIGGFATFVIIYLSNSNVGLFRRKDSAIKSDEELETETSNIFEINYPREIDRAISKGNHRFAVRLLFLQLLKNMSARNIIQYKPDRTDFDYLLQTYSTRYYNDFFRLTRTYEYAWYGQFDIDPEKFKMIHRDFETFYNKLSQS
jgi:hypothetical protein